MADEVNEQQMPEEAMPTPGPDVVQPAHGEQAAQVAVGPNQAAMPAAPAQPEAQEAPPEIAFSWQASEYVHHHKTAGWYVSLAAAVVILATLAYILHFWIEIGMFIVMGIAVFVYAQKPPRTMMYELSSAGIHIDGKVFPFADFRSFGVMPDEEWHSIDLEPAKRFNPRVVLLFGPEDLDQIVGHLTQHLPRVDRNPDVVERITRYLRF